MKLKRHEKTIPIAETLTRHEPGGDLDNDLEVRPLSRDDAPRLVLYSTYLDIFKKSEKLSRRIYVRR